VVVAALWWGGLAPGFGRFADRSDETTSSDLVPSAGAATPRASFQPLATPDGSQPGSDGPAPADAVEPTTSVPIDVRGRLVVRSDPAGALVTVDGRLFGETPTTVDDLPLGTHTVRVARPGHVPGEQRVTLAVRSPSRFLTFDLAPGLAADVVALGAIDDDSRPRGARVILAGRFLGRSPLRVPRLKPGRYALTLELGGYHSMTSDVDVEAGQAASVRPVLRSLE
jgi:hypothetical protein